MFKLLLALSFLFLVGCDCNERKRSSYNFEDYSCSHEDQAKVNTQSDFCYDNSPYGRSQCSEQAIKEICTFKGTSSAAVTTSPFGE